MTVPFLSMTPGDLAALSKDRGLSLNAEEMAAIQTYFASQGRPPTDAELETLAQTWSEHCKHKTFRAAIHHVETDGKGQRLERRYDDLLKDTIVKVTDALKKHWCLSVFKDNAGIVDANLEGPSGPQALAFKVETHNHPSALEPYGGAGTGLGGVIRDVLGAGLGARPIANTDVFCFGPLDKGGDEKTGSGLSTRRIVQGVVSGVRDYGNRMGIPTVNGAVYYDPDFKENPLVFCGTLGLMPRSAIDKSVRPGDKIVMAGGRVGRDGIHGATFSSDTLTAGLPSSVVQIGNPIVQKKMMDVLLAARDRGLYRGITDCGAGGLSSAVGEMGEGTGAEVRLDRVPLKYDGIAPWEIWLSESQERMVMAVPPDRWAELKKMFEDEDVDCSEIGVFTDTKRLRVLHNDQTLVDVAMGFLHDGVPKRTMNSCWAPPPERPFPEGPSRPGRRGAAIEAALVSVLSQPTVASKEWVVRQYDHEVQGRTVGKPLVGPRGIGPADAAVLQLHPGQRRGVALACGLNPHWSRWDPYWMAASAIDEAVRNVVAVGARLDRIAILDNFCGGNPWRPEVLGELVRTAQACHDVAMAYGLPFISGKDSLFNEFVVEGSRRSIPTTLLISALSLVDDVSKTVSMDLKKPGHLIYAVGETRDEMGGSRYGLILGTMGGSVPTLETSATWPVYQRLARAMEAGLVASCHDCSDGGLIAAVAEMAVGSGLGVRMTASAVPMSEALRSQGRTDKVLFSESNGRFVVEVAPRHRKKFEAAMGGSPTAVIGETTAAPWLRVEGMGGQRHAWRLADLEKAWRGARP